MPSRRSDAICAVAILMLAAVLIAPLFRVEYLDNWGSIDSTFIADARFLAEQWPHPLWQPLWYCGTRFDYIYPPALRYGTAGLALAARISTARAYHIYTAVLYCLGIAGVYLLARTLGLRRRWAAVAATASAVLSPSFLVMRSYRDDAALHMPQRFNVLLKWGEGPHMSALALLPFALLFTWRALRGQSRANVAWAAVLSTLVVAHNFYGAVALTIFSGIAVWSVWVERRDREVFVRAAWIAVLAYGLAAWWLTPSYLRITAENLKLVAQPGNSWSRWIAAAGLTAFGAITWRWARGRKAAAGAVFLWGIVGVFAMVVIGHYYLGFRVVGEPHRLVPELDLALILAIAAGVQRLAGERGWREVLVTGLAAALILGVSYPYITHAWSVFEADANYRDRPEYRMSGWIAEHLPGARVFATGSLRFWYDAWHDGAQVGGGSEQGLLNGTLPLVQWQVIQDTDAPRSVAWLRAMGADAIVVPQPLSREIFHEYKEPRRFAGALPVLYDDGEGDVVYGTGRRYAARARVVRTAEIERIGPIPVSFYNLPEIEAYLLVVENGPATEVEMRRTTPEEMKLQARLNEGESVVVQESYDPAWHAYSGGRALNVTRDAVGFMVVHAPPGEQEIRLVFELPMENRVGRVVSILSAIAAILFARSGRSRVLA